MLVTVAAILEGGALGVIAAVRLGSTLADFDGVQGAVALTAGVMGAGLNGTSDFVIDMIHRKSLLLIAAISACIDCAQQRRKTYIKKACKIEKSAVYYPKAVTYYGC